MEAPPGWINQSSEAGEVEVGSEGSRNVGVELDDDDEDEDGEDEGDETASKRLLYMVGTALDVSEGTRGEMMAW